LARIIHFFKELAFLIKLFVLLIDLTLLAVSVYFANLVGEYFDTPTLLYSVLPILLSVGAICFLFFKTNLIILRYVGLDDIKKAIYVVVLACILGFIVLWGVVDMFHTSLVFLVITFSSFSLATFRFLMPILHKRTFFRNDPLKVNTVIFGAGDSGANTLRLLKSNKGHNYNVIAFFDDNPKVHNKFLNATPVYNPSILFEAVVKNHDITKLIISVQSLSIKRKKELLEQCNKYGISVQQVPPMEFWAEKELNINQIEDVKLEDLLSRSPITISNKNVSRYIKGKIVFVTGGAGSIGSEIVRQLVSFEPKFIVIIDNAESPSVAIELEIKDTYNFQNIKAIIADVSDKNRLNYIFNTYKPNIVFHAAAYKHVPVIEDFPSEGIRVNVKGTKNVADLAVQYNVAKVVMISTDKAVNPTNAMGASKRIAEIYAQSLCHNSPSTEFITTRFGNVLGSNGSVIPRFKKQIEAGGPLTVTHPDITRYFMTIPEACQLVLEAGSMGTGGEIFIFDMGEPVKILELAENLIRLSNLTPYKDIDIVFTGLRPGEKLTEELLDDAELVIPTHHKKIKKAKVRVFAYEEVAPQINELIRLAEHNDEMNVVRKMKEIVPEFISNNSPFGVLDVVEV
jgi:FlaA1/EpsC-like NDP-sugar epimerase